MTRYNKLIAALVGNVVALVLAWVAVSFPGVAECAPATDPTLGEVCSVLGFSQVQITAALMFVVNAVFVERWAANTP